MQGSGALGFMDPQKHKDVPRDAPRNVQAQRDVCAQGCTHMCYPTPTASQHVGLCTQELRREILAWAEPWPPVQALAGLLQGHDCILRVKLLLPHVFGSTCSEPRSLFVNNGRDVADSPQCSRSQQGSRAAFAQW